MGNAETKLLICRSRTLSTAAPHLHYDVVAEAVANELCDGKSLSWLCRTRLGSA